MTQIQVYILIALILLLPFMYFIVVGWINNIIALRNIRRYNKAKYINYKNYTPVKLKEVEPHLELPRGHVSYFASYVPKVCYPVKQKKYVGNTLSGIKVPFLRVNIQNRAFMDQFGFSNLGEGYLIITNQKILASTNNHNSFDSKEIKISSIKNIELVGDDRSLFVIEKGDSPPLYFSLKTAGEAVYVQNLIYTLINLGKSKPKEFRLDNIQPTLPGDPMSDKLNKAYIKMRTGELRALLSDFYYTNHLKDLKKGELINLIEDANNGVFVQEWLIVPEAPNKKK